MEDDQAEELEDFCRRAGKSVSVAIRDFVLSGLHGNPQPAPQPAPQPVPQPAPQPAPAQPGKLHPVLVSRIGDLVRDRLALVACLTLSRVFLWAPKAVSAGAAAIAVFSHNGYLARACCWIWAASAAVDSLWVGRERKVEVLERAVRELWDLISCVPYLYAQQCLTKTPEAATAAVLQIIQERRARIGQFGMKDVGISSWNPES